MTLLFVLACSTPTPPGGTPASAPEPAAAPAPSEGASKSGVPDPLAGLSKAEICASDSLKLLKWDYDDLQARHGKICCGGDGLPKSANACHMDWPFNDVPDCSSYGYMRNAIFARYGYTFSKPKWQMVFGKADWYEPREDFSHDWLPVTAKKNVARLQQLENDKVMCQDYPDH